MAKGTAIEIIPAILVKSREELLARIMLVAPFVKTIQIDVMDGKFVPNLTTLELDDLPKGPKYEFHWMVEKSWESIKRISIPAMHIIHAETVNSKEEWELAKGAASEKGGALGIAVNPETYLDRLFPFASDICYLLIMTVRPGFDGQKYMPEMEKKIAEARAAFPEIDIEVDGGINLETIPAAKRAGANKFAAASAIFAQKDIGVAITNLKKIAGALR